MKAIIKDNKAYCPNCEAHDYRLIDYSCKEAITTFECKCRRCSCNFNYNYKSENTVDVRF